ncbi:MAG: AraC family transcriptional regulator ligand-binding domain-containing protein [Oleiphilaceae bacterium]|nr:AraC family transcriptional regulator ligand-binding domain-containing protein [Oleiphilaceae bacterium]
MTAGRDTVATFLQPLMRYMQSRGQPTDELLARHGLTGAQIADPEQRIPVSASSALLDEAQALMQDSSLGINVARFADYTTFGGLGLIQAAGGDFRTALQRVARFHRLISDLVDTQLEEDSESIGLYFRPATDHQPHPQAVVFVMASLVRLMRGRISRQFNPQQLSTPDIDPALQQAMARYFRCPVQETGTFMLAFNAGDAQARLDASDSRMAAMLERSLNERLAEMAHAPLSQRLALWLERQLPDGEPSLQSAAEAFHLSSRSLQRHLGNESLTWHRLLEQTRKSLAERHLLNPDTSITQLAFLLGFSDVSAFSRAFRKWYGVSPSAYRQPPATSEGR